MKLSQAIRKGSETFPVRFYFSFCEFDNRAPNGISACPLGCAAIAIAVLLQAMGY